MPKCISQKKVGVRKKIRNEKLTTLSAEINWSRKVAIPSKCTYPLEREFYETYAILPQAVAQMDRPLYREQLRKFYANKGIKLA